MVDGVELVLRDQPLEVRELERDHALRLEQARHAADEVVEVGHLREDVVGDDQVGRAGPRPTMPLGAAPRRRTRRGSARPSAARPRATLAAGSMPSTGTPQRQEVLQQVAVVAGELDHEAVRRRARAGRVIISAVAPGVLDPAGRVGREVGVLAEDRLRAHVLRAAAPAGIRSQTSTCSGKYSSTLVELVAPAGSSRRAATCRGRPPVWRRVAPQRRQQADAPVSGNTASPRA